ncbi:fluoride efflux transporter CrcB [Aquibaculum arenosum]|uniref:Fluoride-specific ion channel FluC n=1 Tax=Aquibaculum arenosum TaxID=3032591 RepID=A0ABT5YJU2_9PROT|nr:fluoride efflux transporter CrcB [Fodinicurvata sp. CAU 1616]MDF2095209.1 fluoride efflux transporter CrcB [Fodinicurvata sp. CAU 1616]
MSLWGAALLVAAGSACGGLARHAVSSLVGRLAAGFPWGTLAVNVSGSFLIGILAVWGVQAQWFAAQPQVWLLAGVGFLGSYTTVSSFSLQTLELLQARRYAQAAGNLLLSLGLCLAAVSAGAALMGAGS